MNLLIEKKRRVLELTLNRPEKRNALTSAMCEDMVGAVEAVQDDAEIGSILIRAVGQVFCAGMDLDEAVAAAGIELGPVHERLFSIGFNSNKPIIVSVNGAALGGGLGLVAQGHVVVAERSSVFALPEIRIGLWPFLVYRAVESSIGTRRTLALSLTGRSFDAEEALAWGLVHRVCPDDEVCDRGSNLARDIAKACPRAIHAGMTYVRESRGKSLAEAGEIAAALRDELMRSDDFKEGVDAFKHKREAEWPSIPAVFYSGKHISR
jgi:enoyl-CoA hydratase/carnithine racemase